MAESINKNTNKKIIILTHFPPTQEGTIDPSKILHESFGNLLDKVNLSNVSVWISGHTHWSYDFIIDDIRFISNQCGYPFEFLPHSNGYFEVKVDA